MKEDMVELKKWINYLEVLIEEAYTQTFALTEHNYVRLSKIEIDNDIAENLSDCPYITLEIVFSYLGLAKKCVVPYHANENRDFNLGYIAHAIEKASEEDDE